ncbi:hypothetical protein AUR64_12695 [Haloprofundus marisrubri]|uniref:Uncharacterized protein n=1 Tax=Haloprofundus marisrubri TaxID=1514971 RepID=A0A0W1RAS5_9EURY|nr:hypothetical protein [Haloprofundus marisrubri]KTG10416.1 hypothetical protein AUR64_12695 [Haloprofundus marisrubri]
MQSRRTVLGLVAGSLGLGVLSLNSTRASAVSASLAEPAEVSVEAQDGQLATLTVKPEGTFSWNGLEDPAGSARLRYGVKHDGQTDDQSSEDGWTEVESPTAKTLYSVVQTQNGPHAVGAGGDVLARSSDGWELVLDAGPTTQSNPLRGAAVTDDGQNVWFAGGSGVIGQYDVVESQLTDYSAPNEKTSTWEDIAVTGDAGSETVHLVNGSGEVLRGTKTDAGGMDWGTAFKPGGGSSMKAIDFLDTQTGYISDTNGKVYETTDGGESYSGIGVDGGSVGLYDVTATATDDVFATGGDGSLFRYNGAVWTKLDVSENSLNGVSLSGERGLAVGGSGAIYARGDEGWESQETPTSATLNDVVLGDGTTPDVAVGSSGTILERDGANTPGASGYTVVDEREYEIEGLTGSREFAFAETDLLDGTFDSDAFDVDEDGASQEWTVGLRLFIDIYGVDGAALASGTADATITVVVENVESEADAQVTVTADGTAENTPTTETETPTETSTPTETETSTPTETTTTEAPEDGSETTTDVQIVR